MRHSPLFLPCQKRKARRRTRKSKREKEDK
jgi:hypothetical protein